MKRIYISLAFLIIFVGSCTNEIEQIAEPDHNPDFVEMVISAGGEVKDTKLAFDEYPQIAWKEGDKVSVIGQQTGNNYEFTAQSSEQITKLKGYVDPADVNFFAVYPYDATISLSDKYNDTIDSENKKHGIADLLSVTVPTTQYATPESFDPNAYVIAAAFEKDDENIEFKTACSLFKFKLGNASNVKSVKIEAKQQNTVTITGTSGLAVDYNSKGYPYHGISGTWGPNKKYVELVEKVGGHQFTTGTEYFVAIRANTCPYGITVTVTYDNDETFTKETSKPIFQSPERNKIANLGVLTTNRGALDPVLEDVLDFSYAGYNHGETAPEEVIITKLDNGTYSASNGYKVYDVTKYKDEGETDRKAFLDALEEDIFGSPRIYETEGEKRTRQYPAKNANAILYFPKGEYILHTEDDNAGEISETIVIRGGNFIIKGAGREETKIIMKDYMKPNVPISNYSSPEMIQLKNVGKDILWTRTVVGEIKGKGEFSVFVNDRSDITEESWVCLSLNSTDDNVIDNELLPYSREDGTYFNGGIEESWEILSKGVQIIDYHKVKSVEKVDDKYKVTFYEPLMHDVNPNDGWIIQEYPHYENVGVEDLTFVGYADENFSHHGTKGNNDGWYHDGGFKPLSMMRLTDSWIRRVDFISTSEGCTFTNCSNISAYDITFTGNRGHASIRSQASSRVLIAATKDLTSNGAGNWHGVGVSKHTMGTVLWRNTWGDDSCFESHANQPRATLIDCCKGGWHTGHMGGNAKEAPHHLADLTIWNFEATQTTATGEFQWWESGSWRFLPPIIVGFRPASITFKQDQIRYDCLHGEYPYIESLYEYQLKTRLGAVPVWLTELKRKY